MAILLLAAGTSTAAELKIVLPQNRTAFQTNEWIDISVIRSGAEALPAGPLTLTLSGKDGSKVGAAFAVPAVTVQGKDARATEHYHINGWLLRPGHYAVEVAADGATATSELDVYNHIRQSSFKLLNWGRAKGKDQQMPQGENSLGFNTFYGHYGQDDEGSFIRAASISSPTAPWVAPTRWTSAWSATGPTRMSPKGARPASSAER
jgi:hypothetical protein